MRTSDFMMAAPCQWPDSFTLKNSTTYTTARHASASVLVRGEELVGEVCGSVVVPCRRCGRPH